MKDGAEFLKKTTTKKQQKTITVIINKCIASEIVPNDMEFARVRPIFKKNGPLDDSN